MEENILIPIEMERYKQESAPPPEKPDPKAKNKGAPEKPEEDRYHYVVLLDSSLEKLPIEACLPFSDVASITRDFHFNFLIRRLKCLAAQQATSNTAAAGGKKKGQDETPKFEIPEQFTLDMTNGSYILDPKHVHKSAAGVFENSLFPVPAFEAEVNKKDKTPLGGWKGLSGNVEHEDRSSLQDLIGSSSLFLFYGVDDFSSQLSAQKLATLDLSCCSLVTIIDHAHVDMMSTEKYHTPLFDVVALFSLLGVNTVLVNRMRTSLPQNRHTFHKLLDTSQSITIGEQFSPKDVSYAQLTVTLYGVPNVMLTKKK